MKQQNLQSAPAQTATNRLDFFGTSTLASQPRILIANDSSEVCLLMSDTLSVAGFNTRAVTDGEAAWSELRRQSYDLLVTDLVMPRLGGLALIQRVRDAGMNLPVIIASDSPSAVSVRDFVKLQIAAVIPKPFDIVEFQNLVKVALLASDGEAIAERRRRATLSVPVGPTRALNNHVLIADDDDVVRGSLAAVLQSEGYEVDEASNGIEAVARALKHKPDLVLLDLNMPQADGWTAFNQLDRITPLLPVIVITARPNQYPEAVRVGVDAFMEKPLNIPVLINAVKRLTNEDEGRHVNRITQRTFVTQLLGNAAS